MGTVSIWHWLIVLLMGFVVVFPTWRILRRMGFSGWWGLLAVIPAVNLVTLWIVAFMPWPIENRR